MNYQAAVVWAKVCASRLGRASAKIASSPIAWLVGTYIAGAAFAVHGFAALFGQAAGKILTGAFLLFGSWFISRGMNGE